MTNELTVATNRIVLCMRWGQLYSAEYVNVLFRACQRHIHGTCQFGCLTDDSQGLADGIESYPIPDIGLEHQHYHHGAWPKLTVFLKDLYGLRGRALFIDLDSVICGSLDEMFDTPGEFIGINVGKTWRHPKLSSAPELGTGVFVFDLGALSATLTEITQARDAVIMRDNLEQVYLQQQLKELRFWPSEWVISFKYHLHYRFGVGLIKQSRLPPPQTKIIAFHGKPRPHELLSSNKKIWGRFPHNGYGAWRYLEDYWAP